MILTVVGARPNFIKIDPSLPQVIVHTGQHYDFNMSGSFFGELQIPTPKYHLGAKTLVAMYKKLRKVILKEKPEVVLVFGDTNSSLAGAVVANELGIPVAHVEAGMRSGNYYMPEETNRIIIDRISTICLCPNAEAALILMREGKKDNVHVVGDPEFDTMGRMLPLPRGGNYKQFILLTIHRNFNDDKKRLKEIFSALGGYDGKILFPCHPRTQKSIKRFGIKLPPGITLLPPQPYKQMLQLISDAKKVITDSGGVQREAFWMNVPVIILRKETEWTEIIKSGAGMLVEPAGLLNAINNFRGKNVPPPMGGANKKIKEILYRYA